MKVGTEEQATRPTVEALRHLVLVVRVFPCSKSRTRRASRGRTRRLRGTQQLVERVPEARSRRRANSSPAPRAPLGRPRSGAPRRASAECPPDPREVVASSDRAGSRDRTLAGQVLHLVDLVVQGVDQVEEAFRHLVDQVVDEHPDASRRGMPPSRGCGSKGCSPGGVLETVRRRRASATKSTPGSRRDPRRGPRPGSGRCQNVFTLRVEAGPRLVVVDVRARAGREARSRAPARAACRAARPADGSIRSIHSGTTRG